MDVAFCRSKGLTIVIKAIGRFFLGKLFSRLINSVVLYIQRKNLIQRSSSLNGQDTSQTYLRQKTVGAATPTIRCYQSKCSINNLTKV